MRQNSFGGSTWYSADMPHAIGAFGAVVGAWVPSPDGACCPPLPDMVTHGYYSRDEPHQFELNAKYGWPPNSCTALIPRGGWPPEWACNLPNAMILSVYREAQNAAGGSNYTGAAAYIAAIRSGAVPSPPGFPALFKKPAAPPSAPAPAPAQAQAVVTTYAVEQPKSKAAIYAGVGILALAAIGGVAWLVTGTKTAGGAAT
jgi:hypothetical protein